MNDVSSHRDRPGKNNISLMNNDSMFSAGELSERLGVPASFVYRAARSLSAELRERGMMGISGG